MIKTVAERIFDNIGVELKPKEELILERILMNIDNEGIGPGYTFKDERVDVATVPFGFCGYRRELVRTARVEIINYQPQTTEEKKYAEILVKAGLLEHEPQTHHHYMLTKEGKAQIFDLLYMCVHWGKRINLKQC